MASSARSNIDVVLLVFEDEEQTGLMFCIAQQWPLKEEWEVSR
jgi:hypothetical protein